MKEISQKGIDLIKSFEGYSNVAYDDGGGVWTIGYGTIRYPGGTRVARGQSCTLQEAEEWLKHDVQHAVDTINLLRWNEPLNQNQFDSLVSFHYNTGSLPKSTLYKKASVNPNDETIRHEFERWVYDNGGVIQGLINRRKKEADLYFHNFKAKTMTLTQDQKDRFADYQDVISDLTVSDLEASTWPLIGQWNDAWENYIKNGAQPGSDRPPNKPDHP